MGGLPGSTGGDADPAQRNLGQSEANGTEVSESGSLVGGDGEDDKHQKSSQVRQSNQGDPAQEYAGEKMQFLKNNGHSCISIFTQGL